MSEKNRPSSRYRTNETINLVQHRTERDSKLRTISSRAKPINLSISYDARFNATALVKPFTNTSQCYQSKLHQRERTRSIHPFDEFRNSPPFPACKNTRHATSRCARIAVNRTILRLDFSRAAAYTFVTTRRRGVETWVRGQVARSSQQEDADICGRGRRGGPKGPEINLIEWPWVPA